MAIDTSIYGNQKPLPSFAESFAPFVDMAVKREQIQTAQAQRPGIEAESKEKQRIAKRNQEAQDIAAKFRIENPDGTISFDQKGAATALASAGYTDESVALTKGFLDNQATQIKNEYDAGMNPLLIAEKQKTLSNDYFDRLANTVSQYKGAKREEFILNSIEHAEKTYGVSRKDPRYSLILGGGETAVANAKVSPYEQKAQQLQERVVAVSEGQLAQGNRTQQFQFEGAGYTPEGKDPSSAISRQAREFARAAGLDVEENMSLFNMQQIPRFAEVLGQAQTAQIMPASTRADAVKRTHELQATSNKYKAAEEALERYAKTLPVGNKNTVLGVMAGAAWEAAVKQNPDLAAVKTAVEVHNADPRNVNDIIDPTRLSDTEILAKIRIARENLGIEAAGTAGVATTARLPGGRAKSESSGTVIMINPKTGRQGPVPADQVKNLEAKGYKKL